MKYYIKTFGCQMNYADSERVKTVFERYGLTEAEDMADAEYIVFNSCAVRKKAEDKLFGHGKQIVEYKKINGPEYPKVIMTGCIVKTGVKDRVKRRSVRDVQNELLNKADWLDYAIPIKNIFKLLEHVLDKDYNVQKLTKVPQNQTTNDYLEIAPSPYSEYQASLPISIGCNHHCTFCTVPFSRGEETFRTYKTIKKEYESYIKNGYKQITLLGQTVNKWLNPNYEYHPKAYGWYRMGELLPNALNSDEKEPDNFKTLIQELDSIHGEYWLNFVSSYPNYFTDDLIQFIADSINSTEGHVMPWIHLALQSGDNAMLEKMYRHYTIQEFKQIVEKFREAVPDIAITTDIIVGFSGETEAQFENSIKLVEEVKFDMIYISEYSVRPDTPAEEWPDDIPKKIKRERKNQMNTLLEKQLTEKNKYYAGETHRVLISDRRKNNLIGKNKYNKDVEVVSKDKLEDLNDYIGQFVDVKITDSGAWGLIGNLDS